MSTLRFCFLLIHLAAGCHAADILENGSFCHMSITHARVAVPASGDNHAVRVTVPSTFECRWAAVPSVSWLRVDPNVSSDVSGAFRITVFPNPDPAPRTTVINIVPIHPVADVAGLLFYVHQAGAGCTFALNRQSGTLPAAGGSSTVDVTTHQNCLWTTTVAPNFVTLPPGVDGYFGNGALGFTAEPNNGSLPRTAAINVAGQRLQLLQPGTNPPLFFSDNNPADPFFDQITLIRHHNITQGCTAGTYCPNRALTRGEAIAMIVRALLGGDDFTFPAVSYFQDVGPSHPFFRYIQKARELDITRGCSNPLEFCSNLEVPRMDLTVLIVRARLAMFEGFAYPDVQFFNDVPPSLGAFPYIQKAKQLGMTNGCTPTTFCPSNSVTRAEAAALIARGLLTP